MSGFVGHNGELMETSNLSSVSFVNASALALAGAGAVDSQESPSLRCNHAVSGKETKYISNSRDEKLFSRIWYPSPDHSTPRVSRFKI